MEQVTESITLDEEPIFRTFNINIQNAYKKHTGTDNHELKNLKTADIALCIEGLLEVGVADPKRSLQVLKGNNQEFFTITTNNGKVADSLIGMRGMVIKAECQIRIVSIIFLSVKILRP
jgi:hypothetical protein